jgi:signal peptidase I
MEDASSNSPATTESPQKSRKKWLIENLTSLGTALLLVFMIRSSIIEAFKIPSGSMIPTLLVGDHIFVNKFAYGLKIPFSDLVTKEPIYIIKRDPPKRGDIIVFMYPKDESFHYIKRVIGVPGDTIEVREKHLYINDKPIQREALSPEEADKVFKEINDPKYTKSSIDVYKEHFEDGNPDVLIDRGNFSTESFGPRTVPADSLFVMGDNRDFSNDSRFWGFVPMRNVKGRAVVIWLSLWMNFSEGQFIFRPERIGMTFH